MATEQAPAFQFYPRDFIGDMDVAAMTLEQAGAYAKLLSWAWLKDGLPNDPEKIRKALHLTPKQFLKISSVVAEKFPKSQDGRLRNPRQEEERSKQNEYRESLTNAGREGAAKRWRGHKGSHSHPNSNPNASSSSSSSSITPLPPKGDEDGRMERLFEHWRACLWKHAKASTSMTPNAREQEHMMALLSRYSDDKLLHRIVEEYVATTDKAVREKPRSLGMLAYWSGEIESHLRKGVVA